MQRRIQKAWLRAGSTGEAVWGRRYAPSLEMNEFFALNGALVNSEQYFFENLGIQFALASPHSKSWDTSPHDLRPCFTASAVFRISFRFHFVSFFGSSKQVFFVHFRLIPDVYIVAIFSPLLQSITYSFHYSRLFHMPPTSHCLYECLDFMRISHVHRFSVSSVSESALFY